jgi:Domain of unknown function (DU1801)
MASGSQQTVKDYLASLPVERRECLAALRRVIQEQLPAGFEEGMEFGMISYYVPLSRYGATYNGRPLLLASLAAQKAYMSLYLMTVYGNPDRASWFLEAARRAGKSLDMGKSCVRFKSLDELPLEVVGELIAKASVDGLIADYEASRAARQSSSPAAKTAGRSLAAKQPATVRAKPRAKVRSPRS